MKKVANCSKCGCEVAIPDALLEAALHSHKVSYCCAYGHSQHYPEEGLAKYWQSLELKAKPPATSEDSNVVVFQKKPNP